MDGTRLVAPFAIAPSRVSSAPRTASIPFISAEASFARPAGPGARPTDALDLSPAARAAAEAAEAASDGDIRWSLVRRVRREIDLGVYVNQQRVSRALDALLEAIGE